MKKATLVLGLILTLAGSQAALAQTHVTVTPQFKVSHKVPQVTFTFSGLPKTHGIYVQQCMAPKKGEAPKSCNPSEVSRLWVSNVPADLKQGAISGKGKVTMPVDPYFKSGDCIHTTCVFFVSSDHNAPTDRSEDQAIPFKFS